MLDWFLLRLIVQMFCSMYDFVVLISVSVFIWLGLHWLGGVSIL